MIADEWMGYWSGFLASLQTVGERKIALRRDDRFAELADEYQSLCEALRAEDVTTAIRTALSEFEGAQGEWRAIEFVGAEMRFLSNFVARSSDDNEDDADEGVSAGKTIKDSIEKVLNLPRWVKKLLNVLNEFLSLIRGG